jgi:hypothetical protein
MGQVFCSGPVAVYTGISTPTLLGYGEKAPRISQKRHFKPVFNDLGGSMVPFDVTYQSQEAFVTVRLTWWNYAALLDELTPINEEGVDQDGDIGTLMILEGFCTQLWLNFPNSGGGGAMPGMPAAIHFPAAVLESGDDQPGTDAEYYDLSWHCLRKYSSDGKTFTLYDHTAAS